MNFLKRNKVKPEPEPKPQIKRYKLTANVGKCYLINKSKDGIIEKMEVLGDIPCYRKLDQKVHDIIINIANNGHRTMIGHKSGTYYYNQTIISTKVTKTEDYWKSTIGFKSDIEYYTKVFDSIGVEYKIEELED